MYVVTKRSTISQLCCSLSIESLLFDFCFLFCRLCVFFSTWVARSLIHTNGSLILFNKNCLIYLFTCFFFASYSCDLFQWSTIVFDRFDLHVEHVFRFYVWKIVNICCFCSILFLLTILLTQSMKQKLLNSKKPTTSNMIFEKS